MVPGSYQEGAVYRIDSHQGGIHHMRYEGREEVVLQMPFDHPLDKIIANGFRFQIVGGWASEEQYVTYPYFPMLEEDFRGWMY